MTSWFYIGGFQYSLENTRVEFNNQFCWPQRMGVAWKVQFGEYEAVHSFKKVIRFKQTRVYE